VTISIANRILLGFAAIVALMVGLSVYSINRLDEVRQTAERIVSRDISLIRQLELVDDDQNVMRSLREQIMAGYLLRALGQQASFETLVQEWTRMAAKAETDIAQATTMARGFAAQSISTERGAAWQRIVELLREGQ
jgi:hypothetical protein